MLARFALASVLASADSIGSIAADLHAALQAVADNKSSQYNCSVSIAFLSAQDAVAVAAASDREAAPSDRYAFGSGTKPLTGSSVLKLVSEGRFGLDDPVAPLVDPFLRKIADANAPLNFTSLADIWGEEKLANVTICSLMTMRSSVPDFDTDGFRQLVYDNPGKSYSALDLLNLDWVKGQWWDNSDAHIWYSSVNYMLLGSVLAHQAGVSSLEEYDQGLFLPEPLKQQLKFVLNGSPRDVRAVTPAYDRTKANMPNGTTNKKDISDVNGVFAGWTASDVFGSAPEMAEMITAIYGPDPRIARGDCAELMRNASDWYGYSTFNLNSRTGQPSTSKYGIAYGHLGATYGYQSIMAYLPGFDIALVVATNIETQDQVQPADAFCFAYQAIAGLYTGKDLNCSFGNAGYYTGGCHCNSIEEVGDAIVV